MSGWRRLLLLVSLVSSATPIAAQQTPLSARLADSRLWASPEIEASAPSVVARLPLEPEGDAHGIGLPAGYLVGALLGLRLTEAAPPPMELGLWLGGWYEGAAISDPLYRPAAHGYDIPSATAPPRGADPPFVEGTIRGFLRALAMASGR